MNCLEKAIEAGAVVLEAVAEGTKATVVSLQRGFNLEVSGSVVDSEECAEINDKHFPLFARCLAETLDDELNVGVDKILKMIFSQKSNLLITSHDEDRFVGQLSVTIDSLFTYFGKEIPKREQDEIIKEILEDFHDNLRNTEYYEDATDGLNVGDYIPFSAFLTGLDEYFKQNNYES